MNARMSPNAAKVGESRISDGKTSKFGEIGRCLSDVVTFSYTYS